MALGSMTCRGQRNGVGTGGERGTERRGERTGSTGEEGNGQGTAKGEVDGGEEANGSGREKATVGGERNGVPGVLQGRKCRLYLALTTSGTGETEDWSQNFVE